MKILFASAEVSPFAKTGGLGDVCGALPKALADLGHDVLVFVPYYREAREYLARTGQPVETLFEQVTLSWDGWSHEITVYRSRLPGSDVPVVFIANDYFYNRESIYAPTWDGHDDNLERYVVFCRAVILVTEMLGYSPEIVHAHDWHTAFLPVYLHSGLRGAENFRLAHSVYTIHNLAYQGQYPADRFDYLGLHSRYWNGDAIEHYGNLHSMKGGIVFADQVTSVSPNYAREIQGGEFGAGLDGLLRETSYKLTGILNGIDTSEWDPATDLHLPARYGSDDFSGKEICKEQLCLEAEIPYQRGTPLIGIVSRLVSQKGLDLLLPILRDILAQGAQMILLGSGEPELENAFRDFSSAFPSHFRAWIGFDNARAHRITAGCDIFLMPSRYEPCGLNQMYSLRYGTPPVVRMTGGLADTVIPFNGENTLEASGFGFGTIDPQAFHGAVLYAIQTYARRDTWERLQRNGMRQNFSWERSARRYEDVYRAAMAQGG